MFAVEYYSDFDGKWEEYIAPTWGARKIRHKTAEEAGARMARLVSVHPRDKFRVRKLT